MSIRLSVLGVLAPGLAPAARLIPTLRHSLLASESEIPTTLAPTSTHPPIQFSRGGSQEGCDGLEVVPLGASGLQSC